MLYIKIQCYARVTTPYIVVNFVILFYALSFLRCAFYGPDMNGSTQNSGIITRFAPSPSGLLHKGHAYSALLAYEFAKKHYGRFILRIEDIDQTRCRPEFIDAIYEDLAWLGIEWETPVRIQSERFGAYQQALSELKTLGVIYPCFCTRKDIQNAANAPHGPEGVIYPGTCKKLSGEEATTRMKTGDSHAWRLDLEKALSIIGNDLVWIDEHKGEQKAEPKLLGDVVLARKDTPTSYHLSVVIDDADQDITHIIRGEDLWHSTHIHVVLQKLLGLPTPLYNHHGLLTDETGRRFAKRDKAETLKSLRENGLSADALKAELLGRT